MEFGVGLTVVNALSDLFKMTAYRSAEKTVHTLEFSEGVLKKDNIKANKKGIHGTVVEFRVSKKYMGEDAKLPIEEVIVWVESLFYLNSERLKAKGITCKINVYNGMTLEKTYKFKPKPFSELINKLIPGHIKKKQMTGIFAFSGCTSIIENSKTLVTNKDGSTSVGMEEVEKEIHMDIAFKYSTDSEVNDVAMYDTYCNYTNTIDNGVHLDAFDEAYCRFMQNKVNESMSEAARNKMKVTWDDVRTNLFCVLNLSTNAQVGFVG